MLIFAIDPGREKCGVALYDSENGLIFKKVIDSVELVQMCKEQLITHNNVKVIMGNGTSSLQHQKNINELLVAFEQSLELVDEYKTTELATKLYWQEHNPKWWQRILPTSMLIPPQPVDDYVALILAQRYAEGEATV